MGMSDVGADDDAEPYKSLVAERDRITASRKRIAQALLTGGRRKRILIDQPAKLKEINKLHFGIDAVLDGAGMVLEAKLGPTFGEAVFQNRFRMSSYMFENIHKDIQHVNNGCSLFQNRTDAAGRKGASSLQRMVSVMRQLAYGSGADREAEFTGVGTDLGRKCLYGFRHFVVRVYGPKYLNRWDKAEMEKEIAINTARGFPGMMGNIDCCHWKWKNCPMGLQGVY